MAAYRFMYMSMDGNRDDTSERSTSEVLEAFPVTPTDMSTKMHMLGLMYAPTDRMTLMAMFPFVEKDMNHTTRTGVRFKTRTSGVGDFRLNALTLLWESRGHRLHANTGLSFPTGSTDKRDRTPMGRVVLPYPMQLGSGTWDLLPGLTYLGQTDRWSWGSQILVTARLGRNDDGYSWGERLDGTVWGAYRWSPWVSTSFRAAIQSWGNIDGQDDRLDPTLVPTADPNLRGGDRLDLLVGANLYGRTGYVKGHRLAIEVGLPVWQDLDGPQLELDWVLTVGWQYAW